MSIANDELLRDTLRENDRLRAEVEGLKKYARHRPRCDVLRGESLAPGVDCDCGLTKALRGGEAG